jgi:hypothetical protein
MSIFGSILSKIMGTASTAANASMPSAPPSTPAPAATEPASAAASPPAGQPPVDVVVVLTEMASQKGQALNWQTSIVDVLKLLDLDSSLGARKQLADELGYSGDENDSAAMNIWLHKQVMIKLAENGGKVPDSLRT